MNYAGVISAILDILIIIVLGYIIKRTNLVSENMITELNKLCFTIFFPVKIMMSFYRAEIAGILTLNYFIYVLVAMLVSMLFVTLMSRFIFKNKEHFVINANASYRGNFIIMSFPILESIYGEQGIAIAGAITGISQFFYNFYSIGLFESLKGSRISIPEQLKKIVTTPLMIGVFAGVILYFTKLNLYFAESPLRTIGNLASPTALICLGYGLNLKIDKKYLPDTAWTSVIKLILMPLIALLVANFFKLTEMQRIVAVVLFGSPTAVNTFVFSKHYRVLEDLARYHILVTTILYLFTILFMLRIAA